MYFKKTTKNECVAKNADVGTGDIGQYRSSRGLSLWLRGTCINVCVHTLVTKNKCLKASQQSLCLPLFNHCQ